MCCKKNRGEVRRGSAWAMVTGAGRGIGRQYAERLAELGYNVVMVDIDDNVVQEADIVSNRYSVSCVAKVLDMDYGAGL